MRMTHPSLALLAIAASMVINVGCELHSGVIESLPVSAQYVDPPSRVARLSYLQGSISFQAAGTEEWSPAVLNRPLTVRDQLWTDTAARAELHLGFAAIRLDARTNLAFLSLDDRIVQVKVTEGVINLRLRRLDRDTTFELDTPNAAITLLQAGEYRLEVTPDGNSTRIVVRAGEAEVTGATQAFTVTARQQASLTGTDSLAYEIVPAPGLDAFDKFCLERDAREDRAETVRYVSPDVIGYYDLDEFGAWRVHAAWGPMWVPRAVPVGWAPYRFGQWVWVEPWGWTWIDETPWGFAPFHYGRWIFLDARWCWIPGPIHVRTVYAPALVVFVGGGRPGFRFFYWLGGAGVAWFPLGPREVYVPPYHCSRTYITNVNITNTVIVNSVNLERIDLTRQSYLNRSAPGAVTVVPREAFTAGRAITRSVVAISPREAAAAQVTGTAAPVAPTRQSVSPPPESGTPAPRPPDASRNRPAFVQRQPAPTPVPFERKQPGLNARPGRPLDRGTLDELRRGQPEPARPEVRPVRPAIPPSQSARVPAERRPSGEVKGERKSEERRSRAIQNEQRRADQARPAGKQEQLKRRPEE